MEDQTVEKLLATLGDDYKPMSDAEIEKFLGLDPGEISNRRDSEIEWLKSEVARLEREVLKLRAALRKIAKIAETT